MDRDQGVYQPYYPAQQVPIAQWDNGGQPPYPHDQQQGLHGGYQYIAPAPYQQRRYPHADHQQPFHQPQYGHQTQPGFAASQQSHYQMRQPGQQPQPAAFAPGQGQYYAAQSVGGPGRSAAPPMSWQHYPSISTPGGPHNQRQPRHSYSRVSGSGSNSAYSSAVGSDGPSAYHQSSGGSSGMSTPQHGAAPVPLGAGIGMSKLPAKPTFEPSGGAALRQSPRSSIGAGVEGDTSAAVSSGVVSGKPLSKSSLSMGQQLLGKLPPLPALPAEPQRPPSLADLRPTEHPTLCRASSSAEHDNSLPAATDGKEPDEADETRQYLSSLLAVIEAYKAREDAMQMRVEALAFRPAESWRSISAEASLGSKDSTTSTGKDDTSSTAEATTSEASKETEDSLGPAPVLGVRLLRKVSELQKENEELGELLSRKLGLDEGEKQEMQQPAGGAESGELAQIREDLEDAQQLLDKLSGALKTSEARAERAERALEAAVQTRSKGILG
ncbi:hypothetical protein BCV69DRAFT_8040 [Microstroma glucosiphilum]|uniref:Uncharacterized protein n=1 Tax=Pseudomicrostroma glucosiphilum TaxID=1684307 RepID=A0A316UEQ2_9BASI|nr:hypothetical protein BCV69DRAFT_8040 [Pseudomicrostroma glucosiphilum]PWN23716.1 hypothetical protein BCV69DRAFT_8040 [Pseudomicrostroma glucosiphilum]